MSSAASYYPWLAEALEYPTRSQRQPLDAEHEEGVGACAQIGELLRPFRDYVATQTLEALQELYTRTFDIHALCHLDIGYVLFGEDYKRGQFLVHMKEEHRRAGNDCGVELPDYLPNVLRLLPKISEKALAQELALHFLLPALEKMLGGFKENGNVYRYPLQATLAALKKDYGEQVRVPAAQGVVA